MGEFTTLTHIIENKDAAAMCALDEDDLCDVLLELVYEYYDKMSLARLNEEQRTIFLCMTLENTCQADDILNLTEEADVFFGMELMHQALLKLGAPRTAQALREFIDLMPEGTFENRVMPDWSWFFADPQREEKIKQIDSRIADYPDGVMWRMYHGYITRDPAIAAQLLDV